MSSAASHIDRSSADPVNVDQIKSSCRNCSLHELCLPRGLSVEEVAKLDNVVHKSAPIHRNDALYRQGDSFTRLYAVRTGALKTVKTDADGGEQIIGLHLAGDLMGLDGFDSGEHEVSAVALDTTAVCELPFLRLSELCRTVPGLQKQMLHLIGHEINEDQQHVLALANRNADERLASFLLGISARLESRGYSATDFQLPMARQDIANYLGLAVETVSRLFKRFQDEGWLSVERRHLKVLDLDRLRSYVRACEG